MRAISLAAILIALAACRPEPRAPAPTKESIHWRLVELDGRPVAAGARPVTLRFYDFAIGGHTGCNEYSTYYRSSGESMRFEEIEKEEQLCSPGVMAQESSLVAALAATTRFQYTTDPSPRLVFLHIDRPVARFEDEAANGAVIPRSAIRIPPRHLRDRNRPSGAPPP